MVYADNINDSLAIMKRVVERRCVYMDFNNGIDSTSLPLGLAFGLAMDEQAINNYGKLTEYEKEKILAESKNVKNKEEMQQLIQRISDDSLI